MLTSSSFACWSIWWPMTAPAAPPTTAPIMAPFAVDPVVLFPTTPPTAAPAVAPITAPRSLLLIDAQAESANDARAATPIAAIRTFLSFFIFQSPQKRVFPCMLRLLLLTAQKTRSSVLSGCYHRDT